MSILNHTSMNRPQQNQCTTSRNTTNILVPGQQESRTKFLLFIKILFQLLKNSGDELVLEQAKLVVVQCRYNPSTTFLEQVLEQQLFGLIGGEVVFAKAKKLMAHYLRKQQQQQQQQQQLQQPQAKTMPYQATSKPQQKNPRRGGLVGLVPFNGIVYHNDALLLAQMMLEPSPIVERI